jgi:hypothetical protein
MFALELIETLRLNDGVVEANLCEAIRLKNQSVRIDNGVFEVFVLCRGLRRL